MASLAWLSLEVLVYIYIGYPMLVWVLARMFGHKPKAEDVTPQITLLIPAYNEAAHIEARLRNSLALDYPKDRLEIIVASDGSTDGTNAIVGRFAPQGVRLIAMERNVGKSAMLNRVMPQLRSEVVVLSDASTELEPNALRRLVRPFADASVGCVCGLYRLKGHDGDVRGEGEGLYWRYETAIKQQESRLHSILGAHGAFYAIRKALFHPLAAGSINDDYMIAMRVVEQGFRAVYEPSAVGWEREVSSVEGEFARRRRIAVGNCQQIVELRHLLSPLRGWVAFTFFSHKVLRTLAPVFMIALLLSAFWLPAPWAAVMLLGQGLLYGAALAGYRCQRAGKAVKWLSPPLYFCFGNLAMLAGLWTFCTGQHRLSWSHRK